LNKERVSLNSVPVVVSINLWANLVISLRFRYSANISFTSEASS